MNSDQTITFEDIKLRVLAFAKEREWEQFHTPKNLSMAIAAEAAELMEHFLWADSKSSYEAIKDEAKRSKVAEELADVLIYSIEFANVAGMDIASIISAKMEANARKYPVEKARGRSEKYTEL